MSHPLKDGAPLKLSPSPSFAFPAPGHAATGPKVLQPWLVGLTAVVVFLFIIFVMLLINRFWNLRKHRKANDNPETLEADRVGRSGHVNAAAELGDDKQESKATSL
ncbi:hypothetical protein DUI87_22487 [Hirundo rustica rustica]|uniref:Small integral membrane protein 24 n=1 Tax=Hirundo rustica rustica TaxID=333673 RepID=A0A3M0JIR4_HIRRU|nr:hypothetical protein DUI87_22487 [Hirundo rustica rustica]